MKARGKWQMKMSEKWQIGKLYKVYPEAELVIYTKNADSGMYDVYKHLHSDSDTFLLVDINNEERMYKLLLHTGKIVYCFSTSYKLVRCDLNDE